MFSGIIEGTARVTGIEREKDNVHFTLSCDFADELTIDQSVSHNGVCLTVVRLGEGCDTVTAMRETLECTNLGLLRLGDEGRDAAVAAAATGEGYGAVGAEVVAAVLHLEEIACALAAGAGRDEQPPPGLPRGGGAFAAVLPFLRKGVGAKAESLDYPLNDFSLLPCPYDKNGVTSPLGGRDGGGLGLEPFRIAPGHNHQCPGMLAAEAADCLAALAVGYLGHAAGVHDADVSHISVADGLRSGSFHLLPDGTGLCEVQLAPQCIIGRFLSLQGIHATKLRLFPELAKFFRKRP